MSATDELLRLLDERGVVYRWDNGTATWYVDGVMYNAWGYDDERLTMSVCHLTPEQAVEATLGRVDSYTRDDVESAFVSGYSLGILPVGSDPRWDENRQTVDEHMAELGWVRADSDTLGSDLQAESAKLRELVEEMMRFFEDGDWCTTCESAKECEAQEQYAEDCLMRGIFHDRMRELGVEV